MTAVRWCRLCRLRGATTSTRGRYANLCDGCKHKEVQRWAAQRLVAEAPQVRRHAHEHTFRVVEHHLCANGCGRPAAIGQDACEPCADLLLLAASLPPPPSPEVLLRATEAMQATRAKAEDAIGNYRRAKAMLERLRRSVRVQQQLERQRMPKPKRKVAA